MTNILALGTLWLGLALIASLITIWVRIPTALSEVMVGTLAQFILGTLMGSVALDASEPWVKFLRSTGAILLTFLAGVELDHELFKLKWREALSIGLASFFVPFIGCAAATHYLLGWEVMPSWLCGVALSTTSVAVVYTVMMEAGLSRTLFGQTILSACFITDLATVIALGLIFAPLTPKTFFLAMGVAAICVSLAWIGPYVFRLFGGKTSEFETKFLIFCLLGAGTLAVEADSEAVLPSYIIGMVLAGTIGKDHVFIARLRTLTLSLLTPFYFISAGSLVSIPAIVAAPGALLFLLCAKMVTKTISVYPVTRYFGSPQREATYTTLLLSTGLTFGTIASLFGLSQGIIDKHQYSSLVAAIIGTALVPTVIASVFFLPRQLISKLGISRTGSSEFAGQNPVYGIILHANDGSASAFRALGQALALAKQNNSELHIVAVEKAGKATRLIEDASPKTGAASDHFVGALQRAKAMAEQDGVELQTHAVTAHPEQGIADIAANLKAELLVIGESPNPPWYEWLIGSRAERIRRLAKCPVLIVK